MREQTPQSLRLRGLLEYVMLSIQRTFAAHIPLYICAIIFTAMTAALSEHYRIPFHFDAGLQFIKLVPIFLCCAAALVALVDIMRAARSGFPASPAARIGRTIYALVFAEDRPGNGFHAIVALTPLMIAFAALKGEIPHIHPFVWDETFTKWDLILGGGMLPWQRLQPVFGYPPITAVLSLFYDLWFAAMFGTLFSIACAKRNNALRMQFLLAFSFCWFIAGNVLATVFSSAGPCFYHGVVAGPDPYAAQMVYLRDVAKHWVNWSVATQDLLWSSYAGGHGIDFGISAMPSMHVTIATLLACLGWGVSRTWGIAATLFALLIAIGAIHLGWHYTSDVIAGAVLAVLFWVAAGWVSRYSLAVLPVANQPAESIA